MKIIVLTLLLTGCATPTFSDLPSVKYCEEVRYDRVDNKITIEAKCRTN
jgi:hypothetical protein